MNLNSKSEKKPKVLVALSGGVDSAVAAHLLKEEGYQVEAVYMKNWINEENIIGDCPWQQDIIDAEAVSKHLGIPFRVINFMQDYRDRVVNYLVAGYAKGITPNPDVMCNRKMKFGVLLDWAKENGFNFVATGHYSRNSIEIDSNGKQFLGIREGVDKNKDQSYFLSMVTPEQAQAARFPVGDLTKPQVRKLAQKINLPNAEKKDSQGICFIGEVKINDFLEKFIPEKPGDIVNLEGKVLGRHTGLHRYTLGQRRGIGIPSNTDNEFYIVVAKRVESNELVIAFESDKADIIWQKKVDLHQISWVIPEAIKEEKQLLAKVRYRDPSVPITFIPNDSGGAKIIFDQKQRALAPGQVCAIYDDDLLLGGGVYN